MLTNKTTYDTMGKGTALGKLIYERLDIAESHPKIKEAAFAAAVGELAAEAERFGGKGQVSEAQVKDEAIKRLTFVATPGKAVAWAVETDQARLSQSAYDRLAEVGCTDDNINAAMNNSGSGLWNVIKKLKGKGDLWELKVNGAGAVRCNGKAGAGGKIEFLVASKGVGK